MTGPRVLPAPRITEAQLQATIIDAAQAFGWLIAHQRPARTAQGWRTAITGDPGFPDLVLARDRVIFAELKSDRGRLSPDQERWRDRLLGAGADWRLWRPADLDDAIREIR